MSIVQYKKTNMTTVMDIKKTNISRTKNKFWEAKIVHVTTVHPWYDSRIYYKECMTLARSGYNVVLIVPTTESKVGGDVKIITLKPPSNRLERMTKTVWHSFWTSLRQKGDLYHLHDPELIPMGMILKLLGKCVIYDAHEDISKQIMSKTWVPSTMRLLISKFMQLIQKLVYIYDGIIVATPNIGDSINNKKTFLVRNYPIIKEFCDEDAGCIPYLERRFNIVYVGGLSKARGLLEMIEAMALLPSELCEGLILAGRFTNNELHNQVSKFKGWKHVKYVGWLDRIEVRKLLSTARVGLVTIHSTPNHVNSLPIKLFEYMAAGVPVVASNLPAMSEIIESTKCGLVVDPLSPKAIADAIAWLLNHPKQAAQMGINGQRAVKEHLNWETESKALLSFYQKVLSAS